MKKSKWLWGIVFSIGIIPLAWASGVQQLQQFMQQVQQAQGTFQQVTGQQKVVTGTFAFNRQGQFAWNTHKPYEQRIISNGTTLYQYSPDLEQLVERPVDHALGLSPGAVLFGRHDLQQYFKIQELPPKNNLEWVQITPKKTNANFNKILIGLRHNQPVELVIDDVFGQTNTISFPTFQVVNTLPKGIFELHVPKDVDVLKMQ